jgi:hypothetical protein
LSAAVASWRQAAAQIFSVRFLGILSCERESTQGSATYLSLGVLTTRAMVMS